MPRSTIPPEVRAAAIADLQDGQQPAIVAEKHGIDAAKVRVWKQRYVMPDVTDSVTSSATPGHPVLVRQPRREAAQLAIAELIMDNLRAKLLATQRIAEHAANPAWLEKQTAADVAALFTEIDRSAVAILDRMAGASQRAADSADAGDDAS